MNKEGKVSVFYFIILLKLKSLLQCVDMIVDLPRLITVRFSNVHSGNFLEIEEVIIIFKLVINLMAIKRRETIIYI